MRAQGVSGLLLSLCLCTLVAQGISKISKKEWRKLDGIHDLIRDDIKNIKTKLWTEVSVEIYELNEKLGEALQNGSLAGQIESVQENGISADLDQWKQNFAAMEQFMHTFEDAAASLSSANFEVLYSAFKMEKLKSRILERRLEEVTSELYNIKKEIGESEKSQQLQTTVNEERHDEILTTVEKLDGNLMTVCKTQDNITDILTQKLEQDLKENLKLKTFGKPGFVSGWILMKSQDKRLSQISLAHGLGSFPYKVDVQTRSTSNEGKWWIFPGVSAFQSDDDTNRPYGGVVYFYNATHITLFAPKRNNNNNYDGKIIYTGANKYIGNDPGSSREAYVRIKAWGSENMPAPDFESDWQNLDINDKDKSFYEIDHHLSDYPALVTVHVYCENEGFQLVSDGIGATTKPAGKTSAAGGVVWAFNDESVRIWSLYADKNDVESRYQSLFGDKDGWGLNGRTFDKKYLDDVKQGYVKIRAWSKNHFILNTNFIQHKERKKATIKTTMMEQDSLESDLFFLSVQAEDGVNKGYRFSGYGGAQAQNQPYGGVVYAYSRDGGIRVWSPDPDQHGYSVHIYSPYGNGVNVQATNNVSYITTWIRS